MKKSLSILLVFINCLIYAQELKFEEVIPVDSTVSKQDLYNRARTWSMVNYNDKNNYIIIDDKASGELSGTGVFDYRTKNKYQGYSCVEGSIKYNFSIFVKDGRFKYVFTTFNHKGSSGNLCRAGNFGVITSDDNAPSIGKGIAYDKAWIDVKEKIQDKIKTLVSSLESGMRKKYEGNNEW